MENCLIGIITFNGAHRVSNCLTSIKKWDDVPENVKIDTLIVDDGSHSPKSEEMIWISRHFQVPVLFHANNRGIAKSWNDISVHGNYDYVVLLNDDILVNQHWLTCALHFLRLNERIGAVGWKCFDAAMSDVPQILESDIPLDIDLKDDNDKNSPQQVLSANGSCFAFKQSVLREVGGFNEEFISFYEDYAFGLELNKAGYASFNLPFPKLYHCGGDANYLWGPTFSENAELLKPQIRINQSRAIFRKKYGKDAPILERELIDNEKNTRLTWLNKDLNRGELY